MSQPTRINCKSEILQSEMFWFIEMLTLFSNSFFVKKDKRKLLVPQNGSKQFYAEWRKHVVLN